MNEKIFYIRIITVSIFLISTYIYIYSIRSTETNQNLENKTII